MTVNLLSRMILTRLVPLLFFLVASLPHHDVSDLYDKFILIPLGMDAVQGGLQVISFFIGVTFAFLVGRRALRQPRDMDENPEFALEKFSESILFFGKRKPNSLFVHVSRMERLEASAWITTLLLMLAADRLLIVNNIERIHFLQYAVLAMLLRRSLADDRLVFIGSGLAGVIDEFLQYVMNPVRTSYLDFNDMVLNLLGAACGVLLYRTFASHETMREDSYRQRFRMGITTMLSLTAIVIAWGIGSGRIIPVVPAESALTPFAVVNGQWSFVMSFKQPEGFWTTASHGKVFHILSIPEGFLILIFLSMLYAFILTKLEKKNLRSLIPPPSAVST